MTRIVRNTQLEKKLFPTTPLFKSFKVLQTDKCIYVRSPPIAYGTSGKIYMASRVDISTPEQSALVAVKKMSQVEKPTRERLATTPEEFDFEAEVLTLLDWVIYDKGSCGNRFYLFMELMDQDFYDFIKIQSAKGKVSMGIVFRVALSVATQLSQLHNHHIVHCDLKPENILLNKNSNIKLGDAGFAQIIKGSEFLAARRGTLFYFAPEYFDGLGERLTEAVDVWALGCCLEVAITDQAPIAGRWQEKLDFQYIAQKNKKYKKWYDASVKINHDSNSYCIDWQKIHEQPNNIFSKHFARMYRREIAAWANTDSEQTAPILTELVLLMLNPDYRQRIAMQQVVEYLQETPLKFLTTNQQCEALFTEWVNPSDIQQDYAKRLCALASQLTHENLAANLHSESEPSPQQTTWLSLLWQLAQKLCPKMQ